MSTHPRVPPESETRESETHPVKLESETAESETHPIKLMHPIVLRFHPHVSEARKRELIAKHRLEVPKGDTLFFNGSAREAAQQIEALGAEDDITAIVSPELETVKSETHPVKPESETAESETHPIKLMHPIVLRFRPHVSEARKRELIAKHHLAVPKGDTLFFNGSAREAAQQIEALGAEDDIAAVALGG